MMTIIIHLCLKELGCLAPVLSYRDFFELLPKGQSRGRKTCLKGCIVQQVI